jgi:Tfp pilus assembly protein FimT
LRRPLDVRVADARGVSILETLMVCLILGIVGAIAVPMTANELKYLRSSGDARSLSNAIMIAKMRAAASYTQGRLYADLSAKSFRVETWNKTTSKWVTDTGTTYLSSGDSFGYGSVATPPANTQTTIGQSPACRNNSGDAISGTACIVFSSRGIPVAATGIPTGLESPYTTNALYVTDGLAVYGATVSGTGMTRLWRTLASGSPAWTLQ